MAIELIRVAAWASPEVLAVRRTKAAVLRREGDAYCAAASARDVGGRQALRVYRRLYSLHRAVLKYSAALSLCPENNRECSAALARCNDQIVAERAT